MYTCYMATHNFHYNLSYAEANHNIFNVSGALNLSNAKQQIKRGQALHLGEVKPFTYLLTLHFSQSWAK